MDTDATPGDPPPIPQFPPSLIRAAEHLAAKFQELPWFIAVEPATIAGRICLHLHVRDRGLPHGMVLPTSFETFRVVVEKVGHLRPGILPRKSGPSPLW